MKRLILVVAILLLLPAFVSAHPGRTGKDGCHVCRTNCDKWGVPWGEKHCHGPKVKSMCTGEHLNACIKLCDAENITACFELGKHYSYNDYPTAINLFRKACESDHLTSCLWGGNLIQNTGKQYSPQWKEASKMFKKACDAGEDGGCFNLGALYYREGRASKAKKLFKIACDLGNQPGCDNVKWLSK